MKYGKGIVRSETILLPFSRTFTMPGWLENLAQSRVYRGAEPA
jgi:hypothetical protein